MRALKIALIGILGLSGCGPTATIIANRDTSYKGVPSKVFVLSRAGQDGELDHRLFEAAFRGAAHKCGIEAEVSTMHSLELNPKIHLQRIESYQPDAVLTLRAVGGTKQDGRIVEVDYDAQLLPPDKEIIIWRGSISFSLGSTLRTKEGGEVLAKAIVDQLALDGLFPRCTEAAKRARTMHRARR